MSPTVVQLVESCRDALRLRRQDHPAGRRADLPARAWCSACGSTARCSSSQDHRAHPYVDIAHRAALLYSFATLLIAVFVQFSAWPAWVNLTAAMVVVFFFVGAILSYIAHGLRRDTDNQFEHPDGRSKSAMAALIVGEIGGFGVMLAGFVVGQFF